MQFLQTALGNNIFDKKLIGQSALHAYWFYKTLYAVMVSDDPAGAGGYPGSSTIFRNVLTLLAIDWPDQARDTLRTLLDYWDAGFRSGEIPFEVIPDYPGWFAIKLARQWLGADEVDGSYDFEPKDKELNALNGVLQTWRDPDVLVFQEALDKAADFHVMQSGYNQDSWSGDDRFAFDDEFFWFFPVELLAACRLRQYEGLVMPKFTHPLFEATVMGKLPTTVPVPKDELLDQVLPLYSKVTNAEDF